MYHFKQGYIWTTEEFPKVVGRVYGGEGSATYQLAARPNDECPVHGHESVYEAYQAAVEVLKSRRDAPAGDFGGD